MDQVEVSSELRHMPKAYTKLLGKAVAARSYFRFSFANLLKNYLYEELDMEAPTQASRREAVRSVA